MEEEVYKFESREFEYMEKIFRDYEIEIREEDAKRAQLSEKDAYQVIVENQ